MNYDLMNNNKVYLMGSVVSEPSFSHEIYGEGFYEVQFSVNRLSEHKDIIPVTVSERLLIDKTFNIGNTVAIKGQFRSYNKLINGKSKLMLTVFAREVIPSDPEMNPNMVELCGYICKPPIYRTTPFKREICDLLLAVNRAYNKSDYLPCIAWGRNARFIKGITVGEKVYVIGRIQSREYVKKTNELEGETKTAYEISIGKISLENNIQALTRDNVAEWPDNLKDVDDYYN